MKNFSRRNFLIGGLGAAGSAAIAGSLGLRILAQPVGNRPFEMLVLGDSVMWGQGLETKVKAYYRMYDWLKKDVFAGKRTVNEPLLEAHSGATIFPEFDKKRRFDKRNTYGEVNLSNPAILYQVENAVDVYRNRGTRLEDVDLILMNGSINDFSGSQLFDPRVSEEDIESYARDFAFFGMTTLLRTVRATFPNATIVVAGYHLILSPKSEGYTTAGKAIVKLGGKKAADRARWWRDKSDKYLAEAVDRVSFNLPVEKRHIYFAPIPYKDEHAFGVKHTSRVWEVGQDMLFNERRMMCDAEGKGSLLMGLVCDRAGALHPDVLGANMFFEAMRDTLLKAREPERWLASSN